MAESVDRPQCGLTRAFAEFSLIPDLLTRVPPVYEPTTPEPWRQYLNAQGFNADHIEEADLPAGVVVADYMAEDAWRLVHRLGLVTQDGPTEAGQRIARCAEKPLAARTERDDKESRDTLAGQIEARYRGKGGLSIVQLLQDGARALADSDSAWVGHCPGLLLVEMQYLLQLARLDAEIARAQPVRLVGRREDAMRDSGLPSPSPGATPLQNTLDHADAVTTKYLGEEAMHRALPVTLTELRSTAILLTHTGLLDEVFPLGPVQCLAAPRDD